MISIGRVNLVATAFEGLIAPMALSMHTLSAKGSFVGKTAELASPAAASAKALRVPVVVRAQQQDAVSQSGIRTAL